MGFCLVLGKKGIALNNPDPGLLALDTHQGNCGRLIDLRAHLNGHVRMSEQIMIPVRVFRCSDIRSDHEKIITIRDIHQGAGSRLTTLHAAGSKQKQRTSCKRPISLPPVRPKLFDELKVVSLLITTTSPNHEGGEK